MEELKVVNRSPLNNSKSKAMYSFSKQSRFQLEKEVHDLFYNTSMGLGKRATSLGFGKKYQIDKGVQQTPSPNKYEIQSFLTKDPKKGITFGEGRENVKFVSIFTNNVNPGPAAYEVNPNYPSKEYSMAKKISFPLLFPNNLTPPPGAYELQSMNKSGYYFNSKLKSNISYKIHKSPQKQNKNVQANIGPGSYNTMISSNGKQPLAKNRSQQITTFSKKPRDTLSLSLLAPGPGKYQFFSQFGK